MKILAVVRREIKEIFCQPKLLTFIFGAPILYTLLFGLLYVNNVVKDIPTVIYDESQTQLSRSLANSFEDSEKYRIVGYVSSQEETEEYLKEKKAITAIIIPEEFSRNLKKGLSSQALVMVDGSNLVFANTIIASANEIIQTFAAGVSVKSLEGIGQLPEVAKNKGVPLQLRLRVFHNPTLNYTNFMLLGLVVAVVQQGMLLTVALSMVREKGRMEELKDFSAVTVILGKGLLYWLLGSISLGIVILITHLIFGIPFRGGLASLLALGGVFTLAITFLGIVFSSICSDDLTATQYSMLFAMPSFLYSGFTWPIESMSEAGKIIAAFSPLNYIVNDLRDLALGGYAPLLYRDIKILFTASVVLFLISLLVFAAKRKKENQLAAS